MHTFIFGIYPYIALSVLLIGTIARYDRDPFTWKTSSSQLLRRKQLIIGSVLFHIGVLTIFFGHVVGLLTPIALLEMLHVGHQFKQILAIVVGGFGAVLALVGGFMLLHRRLTDSRILATSSTMDIAILALLLFQLCLGALSIFVSLNHIDGSEMIKFMLWAQGIFTFDPNAASYTKGTSWIFELHIFTGLTIFLLFPFTRLVHIASGIFAPIRYVLRPGYQIVRSRRQAASVGKHPVSKPAE
ncbi:respiratory nitrate reductase subunit gamma [Pseudooceanicola sp.]|uniref:respiratory nitrate reductase subunit gamma n=1 Tax=Pseudooceanicola sp. TaxID=1914328 RepID=UPI0026197D9C|nr:respiratory nitrate reductase subunit gamma [Pseudooceanicola sp.]MDF1856831.1 respiratory nitrate reductase subunit gamma [Pseudooceanicola sp.]